MNSKRNNRLRGYIRQVSGLFTVSLILLVVVSALTAAKAGVIKIVVDGFRSGPTSTEDLLIVCAIVFGIFTLQAVLDWTYTIVSRIASARLVASVRADLFARLLSQDLSYFSNHRSSDLIARVVNDVAAFDIAAVRSIQVLFREIVTILCLLAFLFSMDWRLASVCLAIVFIAALILRTVNRRIALLGRKVQESLSAVAGQITEMIGGIEVILSFGIGGIWRDRFAKTNSEFCKDTVHSQRIGATSMFIVNFIAGSTIAVVLGLMGRALMNGTITEGEFASFLATLYLLQAPANGIGQALQQYVRGMAAGDRAFEILDEHAKLLEPKEPKNPSAGSGHLEFDRVSFSYGDQATLRDVTLSVAPAELVVLVGDSGAGKSTVAKLAQRFYDPESGSIRIDGIDLREIDRSHLRQTISYVGQEVFLFDAPLRFNLAVGNPDATDEELRRIVSSACLDDVVQELPEGLDTRVGERGSRLSGGQRQRIAIARALLVPSKVLVLDEATSALDMDLESRLLQNLVHQYPDRAILAITHRLGLAEIADRVVVMRSGVIAEEGTAAELIAAGGEYRRLHDASRAGLSRSR